MSVLADLREGYPGDQAWNVFVDAFRPNWNDVPNQTELEDLCGSQDFAIVLSYVLKSNNVANWLSRPLPALDGISPKKLLDGNADSIEILRSVIMRMPV